MDSPLGIAPPLQVAVADAFGTNLLAYVEGSVRNQGKLGSHLDSRLASFQSGGAALPLTRVAGADFVDLGDVNPSASTLLAFLPSAKNSAVLRRAAQATRKRLTSRNTVMAFVSKRFITAPSPDSDADAAVGYADAAFLVHHTRGNDRASLIRVTRAGISTQSIKLPPDSRPAPPWISRVGASLPPRTTRPLALPTHVVGMNGAGNYGGAAVRMTGDQREELDRSYAGIKGVVVQDAVLADAGTKLVFRLASVGAPEDPALLGTISQGLDDESPVIDVISAPYAPPVPQPPGPMNMYYGDKRFGCGGRTTPENCAGCCDSKEGTAVGFGMTLGGAVGTAAVLVGVKAGALTGVWAGPLGVAVGALIGGLIGCATALVISHTCYDGCERLYPSGGLGSRRFQLTRVAQDGDGDTAAYVGVDDTGSEWALSTAEGAAAVRAGLDVYVEDADGAASAVVVTREGQAYLRTMRDKRLTNNIGELPVTDEVPDLRGIGLT